jgi:peroxiredoxin
MDSQTGIMPAVGTPAPDFTPPDATGTPVSLHDHRGHDVVPVSREKTDTLLPIQDGND